jgi:hypothetical protein
VPPEALYALRRPGLQIHRFGEGGDLVDTMGHFSEAYGLQPGTMVLVRPDGYIGAVLASSGVDKLDDYLHMVGFGLKQRFHS